MISSVGNTAGLSFLTTDYYCGSAVVFFPPDPLLEDYISPNSLHISKGLFYYLHCIEINEGREMSIKAACTISSGSDGLFHSSMLSRNNVFEIIIDLARFRHIKFHLPRN